jgi:protein gp37
VRAERDGLQVNRFRRISPPIPLFEWIFESNIRENVFPAGFQVLTKRADRLLKLSRDLPWPTNVWQRVSVESERYLDRVDYLRRTDAGVKFLSLEPLLEALPNLDLTCMNWVIVGGESGPGARTIEKSWIVGIREKCRRAGAAFFFKQWGGVQKSRTGRLLEGRTWDEMPAEQTWIRSTV